MVVQMVVWMVAIVGGLSVDILKPVCKSNLIFEISNLVLLGATDPTGSHQI
jgi:hypothetical protein